MTASGLQPAAVEAARGDRPRLVGLRHARPTDIRTIGAAVYFIPIQARVPLKFGPETVTETTLARVAVTVVDAAGRKATGWGETPLSVQWGWPSRLSYLERKQAMEDFARACGARMAARPFYGHPLELGYDFQEHDLPELLHAANAARGTSEPMPHLAALITASAFDIAMHDAYGVVHRKDVYTTYNAAHLSHDLAAFIEPAADLPISFAGKYPEDFLVTKPPKRLKAWHLVGGVDALEPSDLTGQEPQDGIPVLLADWIDRDGLTCLKIKLRGNDASWDYERLIRVGRIAVAKNVEWLTADFNCTVTEPAYVDAILDRLRDEQPRLYGMLLYVEQPFPYDLETHRIPAWSVSARKPLFLDESAHDWKFVRLGRSLGWSGVALKTCKTQSGALLSLCFAKSHGMPLMVQDLSNPMLAQIPHCRLAAHAGTIQGVETNGMQFYPAASTPEAAVHPGLYRRREGCVDLGTLAGPGFGYRLAEMSRDLAGLEGGTWGEVVTG